MSRLLSFLVLTLLAVSISFAQGINGKWKGQMQSPNGPVDLVFSFKVDGDSLTGTVESPMGELPISKGTVTDNTFYFEVNAGEMTIQHQCTFMTDSISMKVPGMMGGETMELMLKRVTDDEKESK
jgi:hypothetical protein